MHRLICPSCYLGAGGIEPGALTLQPCIDFVDEWVTVTEEEIGAAIVGMLQNHSKLIEGRATVHCHTCLHDA